MPRKSDLLTHGRRLNDLGSALVESVYEAGGDDNDARRVFSDEWLWKQLGLLVMYKLKLEPGHFPSEIQTPELIPEGWTVVEDVEPSEFNVSDLEFISFLEGEEQSVASKEMRQRAVTLLGNLGLCDGKRMIACQNEIPKDLHGKSILLPGTVLRKPGWGFFIPCLCYGGVCWTLDFRYLGFGVGANEFRLARRK